MAKKTVQNAIEIKKNILSGENLEINITNNRLQNYAIHWYDKYNYILKEALEKYADTIIAEQKTVWDDVIWNMIHFDTVVIAGKNRIEYGNKIFKGQKALIRAGDKTFSIIREDLQDFIENAGKISYLRIESYRERLIYSRGEYYIGRKNGLEFKYKKVEEKNFFFAFKIKGWIAE